MWGDIYNGLVKEATSLIDMAPVQLIQLVQKLKRVRGMRSRLFGRLMEARLHQLDNVNENDPGDSVDKER